jgi:DNA-binding NarL/FixJ family response regulator
MNRSTHTRPVDLFPIFRSADRDATSPAVDRSAAGIRGVEMVTRVAVVDDQTVFRELLAELLVADPAYEVVGQFGSGEAAIAALPRLAPDLLVLDAVLPDRSGIDVLRVLRDRLRRTAVLLVTAHEKSSLVRDAVEAGVRGIVTKGTPLRELRDAMARVAAGGTYFCASTSALLRESLQSPPSDRRLSPRERQILQMVASGLSSKQIASELGVGEKTVSNHRTHIRTKLGLRDVASFTRYAIEHGLIEPRT